MLGIVSHHERDEQRLPPVHPGLATYTSHLRTQVGVKEPKTLSHESPSTQPVERSVAVF
jgi:hypothetical protein